MSLIVPVAAGIVVLRAAKWLYDEAPGVRIDQRIRNAMVGDGFVRDDEISFEARERRKREIENEIRQTLRAQGLTEKEINEGLKDYKP